MISTVGLGFTAMANVIGIPGQPLNVGVTVIVPEILALLVLVVIKEGIVAPEPDEERPIDEFEFDQA